MIIYQTYTSEDPAESDAFHPTFAEAVARVRDLGSVGSIQMVDDRWSGPIGPAYSVYQAHIERHRVTPTRAGICAALKWIPNR